MGGHGFIMAPEGAGFNLADPRFSSSAPDRPAPRMGHAARLGLRHGAEPDVVEPAVEHAEILEVPVAVSHHCAESTCSKKRARLSLSSWR
jgi:hypothetical protein